MSDGDNTAGNIDPITAAKLASAYNITIYSIAIGKEGKVPFGQDFFGRPRYVENTLNETNLREIAKIGNGKFYRVSDKAALKAVFNQIDRLEKVEIKETRYKDTLDYYYVYLKWAIALLLFWLFLKTTFCLIYYWIDHIHFFRKLKENKSLSNVKSIMMIIFLRLK